MIEPDSKKLGHATSAAGSGLVAMGALTSLVRWPSLVAEREAVNALVVQSQAIRQRIVTIAAQARARLQIPDDTSIDLHLATGLWFRIGDPTPVSEDIPKS